MTLAMDLRWVVKKAARTGVALGSAAMQPFSRSRGERTYALMYHRIGAAKRDAFCIPRADFDAQIALLAEQQRAVSLSDVIDHVGGKRVLPDSACLVTIDDGMLSTFTEALPVLERYGIPAVCFVSSGLIGREIPGADERYMTWEELRALARSELITVGSHAHTHRSLGLMSSDEAASEAKRSREILEHELGVPVRAFAYPFGSVGDFNATTEQQLREAGYEIAFNTVHGPIVPGMDPISLHRIKVEGGDPGYLFPLISRGATVAWRLVDQHLWRLQRVREEIV